MDLFGGKGKWAGAIAVIVTLLAMITLKDNQVLLNIIGGEYAALGATILTVFPFLIAIYFTTWISDNLVVARAIWAVFGIYYFLTFAYTWGSATTTSTGAWGNWAYILGFVASVILFMFMPLIREHFWDVKLDSDKEKAERKVKKAGAGLDAAAEVMDEFSG
jgi:membrane associated rhomboid family serine protease